MKNLYKFAFLALVLVPQLTFASFDMSLAQGARGQQVLDLQNFLTTQGVYSGPITGTFGPLTKKGVVSFQKAQGIVPTSGFFGALTRARANQLALSTVSIPTTTTTTTVAQSVQTKTFTTPTGVVMDMNGNILSAPAVTITPPTQSINPVVAPMANTTPILSLTLGIVQMIQNTAHIEWDTNLPTESKIFVAQVGGSTQVIPSLSGLSTHHVVDVGTTGGVQYNYTIEAIAGTQDKKLTGTISGPSQAHISLRGGNGFPLSVGGNASRIYQSLPSTCALIPYSYPHQLNNDANCNYGDNNVFRLQAQIYDANGAVSDTATVTITATDARQNETLTGTGDGSSNGPYYEYSYLLTTPGSNTITFSANGVSTSTTFLVQ